MRTCLRERFRRVYYNFCHRNTIRVSGRDNRLTYNAHTLRNVQIYINGEKNVVEIAPSTVLENMRIDIAGNANSIIIGDRSNLLNARYTVNGDKNNVHFGLNNNLMCGLTLSGSHHVIEIGNECNIKSGSFWMEDIECSLIIGSNTTIIGADFSLTEDNSKIVLGSRCLFAYGIDFRTGDSHPIFDCTSGERINPAKNIEIGNHVWIAAFVKVLKGAVIGENSVIGIGSIVTKSIPANCIAAGNPARIIRENITWSYQRTDEVNTETHMNISGAEA